LPAAWLAGIVTLPLAVPDDTATPDSVATVALLLSVTVKVTVPVLGVVLPV
jgi:hypothetical protein